MPATAVIGSQGGWLAETPATFIRVPYNPASAAAAISAAELPQEFVADVETGGAVK